MSRTTYEVAKSPKPKRQGPYTETELRAVFTMARLLLLLDDIEELPKMNKRAMLRVLMAGPCRSRSRGSLEAKLMNVSGASQRVGGPTIPGYTAAPNCQKIMIEIARTTFIENSDEHIDLAVYVALMESQSRALQDAAFQPGLLADKLVGLLADFVEASPVPPAYAICPVCDIHIGLTYTKDEESFTGEEAVAHIEHAHPEVCTGHTVPYYEIHIQAPGASQ